MLGLLRNRQFAMLWAGQSISGFGDWVRNMTLTFWVYQVSGHSPLATAAVMVTEYVPAILLGPVAGVFVNRWSYRRTMFWTQVMAGAVSAAFLLALGRHSLPLALAAAFLGSTLSQFYNPTRAAMIPAIVPTADLVGANSVSQLTTNLALVLGPLAGSAVYFSVGPKWSFLLDAATFLVSAATIAAARLPANPTAEGPGSPGSLLREFKDGVNHLWSRVPVRLAVLSLSLLMLGGGAINVCLLYLITRNLGLSEAMVSWEMTVYGLAMIAGSLAVLTFSRRLADPGTLVWAGIASLGVAYVGTGLAPALAVLLGWSIVAGLGNAAVNIGASTLVQTTVAPSYLTRVIGVMHPVVTASALVGTALGGVLAKGFDVRPVISVAGLLMLAGALVAHRGLRRPRPETVLSR